MKNTQSAGNPLLDPQARLVIAHRGNRVRAPENTVASLAEATELGADALEFDVRVTRDGVAVLLHDPDLDRTTNGHGRLADYTLAEVQTLDAAARGPVPSQSRQPIPTLEEVLDRFRELPLIIEVKEIRAAETTEQLVRRMGAEKRVVVGSSDTMVMWRFYRSGLHTCASLSDAIRLIPSALLGARPAKPVFDVLSLTPRFGGFPIPIVAMAKAAQKVGIATHVWTINDPRVALTYWKAGVTGILTDDPAAMIRARDAKNGDG
jgi:glycerophosphoryl diester phosphodiesterase